MHTLMIAVSTLAALGLSGTGIITICHRLDRVGYRLSAVENNQARHMRISARGVDALEHLGPDDSGPIRAYTPSHN